jgi:hypothetical protein
LPACCNPILQLPMKKLIFHVFSCEARVGPRHAVYQPGSRILLLLWIKEADEEQAEARAMALAAEQHYEDVQVREIKHVDAAENQFQGNLAAAFQQMLEVGWSVIAYPEPSASRH